MTEHTTFSIAARCARTGRFGVAVSTAVPGVGARVPHARSSIGAIASQAVSNPYLGFRGLVLLAQGIPADEALAIVMEKDEGQAYRQVTVVDRRGRSAAHTGGHTRPWSGHQVGENYAVAGNLLVGQETVEAMAAWFEDHPDDHLAERLLGALEAGQAAGGDRRGRVSAALFVVHTEDYAEYDLRVDEHADPVAELRRLFDLYQARVPFDRMTPTKANPAGIYDYDEREAFLADWEEEHRSR